MLSRSRTLSARWLLFTAAVVSPSLAQEAEPEVSATEEDPIADLEAKEAMPPPGYVAGERDEIGIGLSPYVPEGQSVLPGGVSPSFGAPFRPQPGKLQFRGYLQAGIRAGLGERPDPADGQSGTTWHGDPVVPGAFGYFESTNTVQNPWTELNFSYSTQHVTATVQLGAWGLSESMISGGYYQGRAESWINDVFLNFTPDSFGPLTLSATVGVFVDRYGAMAQFSDGQYGSSLIGSIYGVGYTARARYRLNPKLSLELEQGVKGDMNRVPFDLNPSQDNEHQLPEQGATYAHHAHAGLDLGGTVRPAVHYISSFSRDDLGDRSWYASAENPNNDGVALALPDGSLDIYGADVRVNAGRFGYAYLGASYTEAVDTITMTDLVQVLNNGGGWNFESRFFGPGSNGSGTVTLIGGQYSLSLGSLLRYPDDFWGEGPDLQLSVFGLYGYFTSDDKTLYPGTTWRQFDGVKKFKVGLEANYAMLSWLGASGRVDYAQPDTRDIDQSFAVLTGKVIFRSEWNARETLTLQYSRFINGSGVKPQGSDGEPKGDARFTNTASGRYDEHVLAVFGTIWW